METRKDGKIDEQNHRVAAVGIPAWPNYSPLPHSGINTTWLARAPVSPWPQARETTQAPGNPLLSLSCDDLTAASEEPWEQH